jgi:hypothetical protein
MCITAAFAAVAPAQEPPRPDTISRPDTARRPAVALPTIETKARREERTAFETKPNAGTISITGRELTSAPRFFGEADILRAVRALPGVNARNDYSVGMNVRGGEADQNLVLLDGYPVYNPFHMGGLFGAFVEPMVDRVDFMTGAFPARYGGRLSSVLDVRSAKEPRPGMHGRADVSMLATTVALGRGMQGGRGTWTVAARRTYADKFADLIKKGSLPYHFRDAQAHVTRMLPGDITLSATAYDNTDDMVYQSTSTIDDNVMLQWGNRLIGTSLARRWAAGERPLWRGLGDSVHAEQRLSRSRFRLRMNLFQDVLTLNNRVLDDRLAGSVTTFSGRHTRSVGYDVGRQSFAFDANYPLLLYPSDTLSTRNTTWGVFFDDLWRPRHDWIVQAGVRLDGASGLGPPIPQPRLSVKYFINPDLALIGAYGEFAQTAHSLAREDVPIRALDFWIGSDSRAPIARARHVIAGAERWLSGARAVRVETFLKQYPRLVEQNPFSDPSVPGDEFTKLSGYSYGGDLMLRQLEGGGSRWSGWLAYSFAFSSRVDENGRRFFPGHDRRHELNLVGARKGGRYTTSLRFNLATGTPYTFVLGEFERTRYDPVTHRFVNGDGQFLTGPRNAERLPLSQRIDVSFTRNGTGRVSVSPFLSVMNVYNAKNTFSYVFDYTQLPPKRHALPQLPIFPTLGMSVVW